MTPRLIVLTAALLLWPAAIAAATATPSAAVGTADNWPSHNGGADETAYSRLQLIDTQNVKALGLDWFIDLSDEGMLEATPLAIDGMLYFTGSYSKVYAVNARTHKLVWTYDPEVWRRNPDKFKMTLPVNRGVAYDDGRVYATTVDGRLIALDAKTGKVLWSVETVPLQSNYTVNAAPRVYRGKVLIGNGGGDFGERGYFSAYDAATGHLVWRFYVVPGTPQENRGHPALERALTSWGGAKPAGGRAMGQHYRRSGVQPRLRRHGQSLAQ